MLLLLAVITFVARQAGLLPDVSGSFTAIDGDSLRKDGKDYRLHAIDAPELFQTCWRQDGSAYDCGRVVSECRAGAVNLNDAMVRSGWAIAYTRHGLDHLAAQEEARAARRGIWQGRFETPEAWRASHRNSLLQTGVD